VIDNKVLNIAGKIFQHKVDKNSKINDFDRWDSLGQLTLFMELESQLEIKFTHNEIIETSVISDIIDLVKDKI
jgi:acyl carrier protein